MDPNRSERLSILLDDIKQVDAMIRLHKSNPSSFMLKQYVERRDKLVGYLVEELIKPDLRSAVGFAMIKAILDRFYDEEILAKQVTGTGEPFEQLAASLAR